ncbi:MAG: SRPBCC domain-containing protein [Alicyclobacillus sp.]|nr:SRPBCC domain-containing protein [Alicyclobacillus sp.]
MMDSSEKVVKSIGETEFTLTRIYSAPIEIVFNAFTDSRVLSQRWAPADYTIPVCTMDLRPGGVWHYCMEAPDGSRHWARAVYREIIEPERIVYTSTFADEHANPIAGIPEHTATITFREQDGMTNVTIRIQSATPEALRTTLNMRMAEGLSMTLEQKLPDVLREAV